MTQEEINAKYKVNLGDLMAVLNEREDDELTFHFYEQVWEMPRTIKNISMTDCERIMIVASEVEEEAELSAMTVGMFKSMIEQHKNVYNTPDETPVVVFDPETATLHTALDMDDCIDDRIDINAVEM